MVFESLVVSVLNHFLGPYIKNLDASQLKLGIWSGDALLERLEIKENAFSQFNLPVRVKGGFLNRLRLKIPWKSKFTDPVIAEVEGLYLIAAPLSATPYDAKKESKEAREKKQNQLKKIEEAKKREKAAGGKESDDGFVAKLVTQIIKNIQITVNNIHVRYEDDVTISGHNFAAGVTLEGLIIQSTDSKWTIGVNTEEGALIYKILQLNSLSIYWDTDTQLFGDLPTSDWLEHLKARISTATNKPESNYILKPLSAEAKATLTTKPGQDPNIPQANVGIVVNEVAVHVDEWQFCGVVSLAESLDRMSVNARYRKYKPAVKLKDNPKLWWHYAMDSVIEVHVKRKTQMWSPTHIKQHWKLFMSYIEKYKEKVLASNPSKQLLAQLEELEDQLDVSNIVVARNEAELRASRIAKKRAETKASSGWFSWFSTTEDKQSKDEPPVIPSDEEIEAERQSLYKAIGYAKGKALEPFAKEYVAHKLKFHLSKVTVELYNGEKRAAMLQVLQVEAGVAHRPSAKGISVSAMVGDITARGIDGNDQPVIVESTSKSAKDAFVDVKFEMNALDIAADNSIRLIANVKPLRITYNATTIEHVIHIFKVPKHVHLQQVSSSTVQSMKQLRTQTRAGLQHVVSQRRVYDINIKLESPYVVVPQNGLLRSSSSVLLVDLGCLAVTSDIKNNLPLEKSIKDATIEQLSEAFYDNFDLKLDNVQVIVAGKGDDWEGARTSARSKFHVLEKVAINLKLKKSLLPNDTRLPGMIVEGVLPDLCLSLSDKKLEQILKIALSIPVPPPVVEADPNAVKIKGTNLMSEAPSSVDVNDLIKIFSGPSDDDDDDDDETDSDDYDTASEGEDEATGKKDAVDSVRRVRPLPSSTELLLKVEVGKIGISLDQWQETSKDIKDVPVLSLEIGPIKADYRKQTWDDVAIVTVAKLSILNHLVDGSPKALLISEAVDSFISLNYCQAKVTGPQFKTYYQSTKQSIEAVMSLLRINVHAESLPKLIHIFESMGDNVNAMLKERQDKISTSQQAPPQPTPVTDTPVDKEEDIPQIKSTGSKDDGITQLHVVGRFGGFAVALESSSQGHDLLLASIKDITTDVEIDSSKIIVKARVSNMAVEDPSSSTPYNKIVSKSDQSKHIVDATIVVFKDPIEGNDINDLEKANLLVQASVAKLQIMVMFQFVKKIIDFATNLQLNRKLLQSAGQVASEQVTKAANALKEKNTSRVKLDIIIDAPLIVVPAGTASDSTDIFVINLGRLEAKNKFIMGSEYSNEVDASQLVSSTGQPAVLDKLSVKVTSIKFHKVKSFKSIENMSEKKVLMKLMEFSAEVIRNLSPWCKPLPLIDVSILLDIIYVYFTPNVYFAIMKVVDSAKILTTRSDGDKQELTESEGDKEKDVEQIDKPSGGGIGGKIIARTAVAGVSVLLSYEEKSLAAVNVKGLFVDAVINDTTITATARLKAVNVSDLSHHSLFPLVLKSEDTTETLFVKVVLHRDISAHQNVDPEICVTTKIQQISIVILYQFIKAVQDFVDQLQLSKKPIEQNKDSVKTTKQVEKSTRSNAMRIKFDIDVNAPKVVIPMSSLRREGFVVDLGNIGISNSFQIIPETTSMETQAILDMLTIALSGLRVYRFVMGKLIHKHLHILSGEVKTEIVVERNLSSWYKDIPLIDVRLYIHPVEVSISDNDLSSALEVLQSNKGEVEAVAEENLEEPEDVFKEKSNSPSSSVSTGDLTDSEESHCVVTASVLVDNIVVQLFHKVVPFKLGKIHGWKRDNKLMLGKVGINKFDGKFSLQSDKTLQLNLSLLNLTVEDVREGEKDRLSMMICNHKITALAQSEEDKMIVLNLIRDKWNRITVNAKLEYLQLLLDVTFIFTLLDFAKRSFMVDKDVSNIKKLSSQPQQKKEQQSVKGMEIKVEVILNEPRIALLEDASKPNSRAIVLQSYFQLVFSATENDKKLAFIGKDIRIILARYATMSHAHSIILAPCTIDLSLTDSAMGTSGYLEIIESVDLVISPATVRLLLHVLQSIPKFEDSGDDGQNIPMSFWNAKPLDQRKWYFTAADTLFEVQDVMKESSVDPVESSSDPAKPAKKEKMVVTLKQLKIVFEKEFPDEGRTVPLILFTGELKSLDKDPSVYDHPVYVEVTDWSRNMNAIARIQLKGSYFNERLDVIEPLLEPVEKMDSTYHLWQLKIEASKLVDLTEFYRKESRRRSTLSKSSDSEQSKSIDDDIIYPSSLPPEWMVNISSENNLQLTLTKTSLEILMELQKSYIDLALMEAADGTDLHQQAVYIITNKLGENCRVTITPKGSLKNATGEDKSTVDHKGSLSLMYKDNTQQISVYDSTAQRQPDVVEITIEGFLPLRILLTGNRLRYYALNPLIEEQPVIPYGLVVEIDRHKETKKVTLKSPIAVYNHLSVSCDLYASENPKPKQKNELVKLGQVLPDETFSIPLLTAHKGYVFLTPTQMGVYVSSQGMSRNDVTLDHFNLTCEPYGDKECFYIRVKPVAEKSLEAYKLTASDMEKRPHHIFHLHYPLLFYNMLPISVTVNTTSKKFREVELPAGEHQSYSDIDITKHNTFTITLDSGHTWKGSVKVYEKMEADDIIVFEAADVKKVEGKSLQYSVSVNQDNGYLKVLFYAKYWVTNKTGQTLQYTGYELMPITHPSEEEVKFFSMKKKNSKDSEIIVRMIYPNTDKEGTAWSRVIPLVAAGSAGTFKLKQGDRSYELGVKVRLSRFGLSMIITITPLFVLKNDTKHTIVVQEVGQNHTISVAPQTTMPFWPVNVDSCKLTISINDSSHKTVPFSVMTNDTILLKTEGKATSAVVMDVDVTELCKIISFKPLFSGAIPCVLINHFSHHTIVMRQNTEGESDEYQLPPGQSMAYTWSDPCKKRELAWWLLSAKKETEKIMEIQTASGTFKIEDKPDIEGTDEADGKRKAKEKSTSGARPDVDPKDESQRSSLTGRVKKLARKTKHTLKVKKRQKAIEADKGGYWVSFLDGLQRVIIFTPDAYIYKISQRPSLVERTSTSLTVSLLAIGLSLVNDIESKEVAYLGLTGSEVIWEYEKKKKRWVAISKEDGDKLESFYSKFENKEELKYPVTVAKDVGANFENMTLNIGKKTYKLRRTFYDGFSAEVSLSKSETKLSARIGRIQLDNQLFNPWFDNVLHAVPPVNEVARKHPPKPFFEVSTVIGPAEHSGAKQYPYFELLIQKMAFNLDLNFVFSLMDLFSGFILKGDNTAELKLIELSRNDLKLSLENVVAHSLASQTLPNYFGAFKIHPLSILLSLNFSYTASDEQKYSYFSPMFNMLKSFGASFMSTDDINLKLSLFGVENKILTQQQLVEKIRQHYIQQGVGQAYKILLGLDLLGNPVGFVSGLASGTKGLFYEPFEGALLGPEEFIQGLGHGVHGFFEATIGGLAGSLGKIFDTIGDTTTSAILTDEEKRKREALRRDASLLSGLGHFASDVAGGITGVVSKPVEGAKKHGVTGFFTGTGKGVAGLFLRPIGGTFDLLNVTFDSIKKVTQRGDYEIGQLRPSRYIGVDGIVQIYSFHLATGNAAFMGLNKYNDTDTYINHVITKQKPIHLLIVTTRRFMIISKGSITGGWQVEHSGIEYTDMMSSVKVEDTSIVTSVAAGKESGFQGIAGRIGRGITGSSSTKPKTKKIDLPNKDIAREAAKIINEATLSKTKL